MSFTPSVQPIPESDLEHLITPYFMHLTIENVPQSEKQGQPVMETREVVQIRFAGDKNYSPIVPADSMYRREGSRVITYAERWADAYAAFQSGAAQTSQGTPLERLAGYGITQSQLSVCRALKIYSVEALHNLEGANLKSLGMHGNELKDMASRYTADQARGLATADEIQRLREELAALRAASPLPVDEKAEMTILPDGYEAMTDDELKAAIAAKTGSKPRGNPSRETLLNMAKGLDEAA